MATSPDDSAACDCAPEPARPVPYNPPERSSLSYRVGTHRPFLRQMLERLPWQVIPDGPYADTRPLAALATHSDRDPTVALLDAFAMVGDVLTFYQERVANEGFLRTATDPRALMELARTLGYELGPGLAASTWLAFTVEEAPGAPAQVVIGQGARVLSIPGQDERPQTFETIERIVARPEWNVLRPATVVPEALKLGASQLWVEGFQANLAAGDIVLIAGHARDGNAKSTDWELRTLQAVTPDAASGRTCLTLMPPGHSQSVAVRPVPGGGKVYVMRHRAAAFGHNAPDWTTQTPEIQARYTATYGASEDNTWPAFKVSQVNGYFLLDNVYRGILPNTWMAILAGEKAWLYWIKDVQTSSHTQFTLTTRCSGVALYPRSGSTRHAEFTATVEKARRELTALGQGESLTVAASPLVNETWGTGILAPFPDVHPDPDPDALDEEDKVTLDRAVRGLPDGRPLIISGKRLRARVVAEGGITLTADDGVKASYAKAAVLQVVIRPVDVPGGDGGPGLRAWRLMDADGFEGTVALPEGELDLEPAAAADSAIAEVVTIKASTHTASRTELRFTESIKYWYDRATVVIYANVAVATHGETVREALGSGDGSVPHQRFTIRRSPVTWVPAATPTGRRSTLEIRVNGVLWHEVASFHDQGPHSRRYLVQRDEQGRNTVIFGDGVHGARLPTGQENVIATYRTGTGREGAVRTGALSLFQTRPLGLRAVTNPLAAVGAEAPDAGEVARREAPTSVLTLARIVGVPDYETFAQTFAGISKARATFLQHGDKQRLHLTLALADGSPVPPDAVISRYLAEAMDAVRDSTVRLELAGFEPQWFRVAATLRISPDYLFEDVTLAARQALTRAFAFERRAFGQGVSAAEVVALLQGVPGIEFVDLDGLARSVPSDEDIPTTVESWLSAGEARWESEDRDHPDYLRIQPAQLLRLDPSVKGLTLRNHEEVQP